MHRRIVIGCALWVCLAAHGARADEPAADSDPNLAQSNALFETGRKQFADGDVHAACESFAQSYALAPRASALLNLGICHERAGQLLLARKELMEGRALDLRDDRSERAAQAATRIAAIEAQLGWVEIQPASELERPTLQVMVDGELVSVTPSEPIAVMPGVHALRLEVEAFEPREVQLKVTRGERVSVMFPPAQARVAAPVVQPEEQVKASQAPLVSQSSAARDEPSHTLSTTALVVGIVGIAASAATGIWALERRNVVHEECDQQTRECSPRGLSAASTGNTAAIVSTVAFGVGVAGFGVWLFAPGGPLDDTFASGGVTVRGRF